MKGFMKMFLGEYNPNITEGSRIAMPSKMRDQISHGEIILSKGFEKCVLVYDKEDWAENAQKQVENLSGNLKRGDLERYLYTSASEVSIDTQGRFVVPPHLKEYAMLGGKTAVIGVGDHIELWDKTTWDIYMSKVTGSLVA